MPAPPFDDRWLSLWVADDARAVQVSRDAAGTFRVTISSERGLPFVPYGDRWSDQAETRALAAAWATEHRMPFLRVELGRGPADRTYHLHVAVLDRAPAATHRYRAARADDAFETLRLVPDVGLSFADAVVADPYESDYGHVPWALPFLDYFPLAARTVPHPAVRGIDPRWIVTASAEPPVLPRERAVPLERARAWLAPAAPRCVACGSLGVDLVEARDGSGTAWRQHWLALRCARCARHTLLHFDD